MKITKKHIMIALLFFASVVLAKNFSENILRIGDGATAEDTQIISNQPGSSDPFLKYDATDSKWKFSNDGSVEKTMGSGSGGGTGVNLLVESNADFEAGSPPDNWVNAGAATFTTDSATPIFDLQSGSWDASATGATLTSPLIAVQRGFEGRRCQVAFDYSWVGTKGDILVKVIDQSSTELLSQSLDPSVGTKSENYFSSLPCPDFGDSLSLRIESTADAAALKIDNAFLGTGRNEVIVSQNDLVAHAYYPTTVNCFWNNTNNVPPLTAFAADTDCPSIVVDYSAPGVTVDTTDNDLPDLVFSFLPKGEYVVKAYAIISASGNSSGDLEVGINDGVTTKAQGSIRLTDAFETVGLEISGIFSQSADGPKTFSIFGNESSGLTLQLLANLGSRNLRFTVEKIAGNTLVGNTYETTGFNAAVKFDATNLTISNTTAGFVTIGSSSLFITEKSGDSDSVQITCTTGTASGGDNCDGAAVPEVLGVSWEAPTAGTYKVCFTGNTFFNSVNASLSANLNYSLQQFETLNTDDVPIRSGYQVNTVTELASNSTTAWSESWKNCHNWDFDSAGRKTVRLYHNYNLGTNVNVALSWQNGAGTGQAWTATIEKLTEQKPSPVFPDFQQALSNRPETGEPARTFGAQISNTGPVVREIGNWVSSTASGGTGIRDITIEPGYCSETPICTVSPFTSFGTCATIGSATTGSVQVRTGVCGGAASFATFLINCKCKK